MKELIGNCRNQYIIALDKPVVMTELIFVTSEPVYRPDGAGGINRVRETEQFRIIVQQNELLGLAKFIVDAAKDAEELSKRVTIEKVEST